MSSKQRSAPRPLAAAPGDKPKGFDFLADFGREQLAMVMDASSAMCRGFEAIRGIQQQAAQQASSRHQAAASRMRDASSPADWMSIPIGLLQEDLQSAVRYWQELAAATLETQTEMMECTGHLIDADAVLESASAMESLEAIPGVSQLFPRRSAGTNAA
jgi:hypothetical protein